MELGAETQQAEKRNQRSNALQLTLLLGNNSNFNMSISEADGTPKALLSIGHCSCYVRPYKIYIRPKLLIIKAKFS